MELKDLKPNDLVSFRFGSGKKLNRGIFKELRNNGNPIFFLTDMGYENQEFNKNLFNLGDLLQRPAIDDDYNYIKECLWEEKLEDINKQIKLLEREKESIKRSFLPTLNDVLNYTEEDYY